MTLRDAFVLLVLGFIEHHCIICAQDAPTSAPTDAVVAADYGGAAARKMVALTTMPPRPRAFNCEDPLSGKGGYEPYCPLGYFRCCANCKGAVCFSEKGLSLSWRGVRECKRCAPGDYCTGCDTSARCGESKIRGREGPRISPAGSSRFQDCIICPTGYEADLDRKRCVKKWKHLCNAKYVGRCVRDCKVEDPKRKKNQNFCEMMKCQLYCAMRWSAACAGAFKQECDYRKAGPTEYDLFDPSEEWLTDCNVDCNGALSAHHLHFLVLLCCMMLALASALHSK